MSDARYIVGDVHEVLASLEPGSVDLVMTSPPFLALRSYLPADHPDKGREIGSEATPGEFIDAMLDVAEACDRVLAPHGSLVFELGDTYAGSGGAGGDYAEGGLRDGAPGFTGSARVSRTGWHRSGNEAPERYRALDAQDSGSRNGGHGWPLDKSKVLIPQLFAVALAYGFNPLTGRQTDRWRVRNTVGWCRPNPPVGRDGDKFRPATSFLTVACKARDRYWDGDAVRVPYKPGTLRQYDADADDPLGTQRATRSVANGPASHGLTTQMLTNPAGAPLLDWWEIPTQPYAGSHYATYPDRLVVPVVKAMCPGRVCRVCGKPSTRIVSVGYVQGDGGSSGQKRDAAEPESNERGLNAPGAPNLRLANETLGWSDCGHDDWRVGVTLDPFAGSGTTLAVATGHGFDAIGIDLDSRNADLATERIGGLFLTVEHHARQGAA